jgi:raffinose/stachyose/melibiose transport system permease protein
VRSYSRIWILLFLLPTLLILLVFYLVPIGTVFLTSFSRWNNLEPFTFTGLSNYRELFTRDPALLKAIRNTVVWVLLGILVHVPLGVAVALACARQLPGWRLTRGVFLIPNLISSAAWALIYSFIFNPSIGLLNQGLRKVGFANANINWLFDATTAPIAIALTWLFYAGVITLLTLSELLSFPVELREAAIIDGASDFQIDVFISLPMLKNIIGTGAILASTSALLMVDQILLLTSGGPNNATMNFPMMQLLSILNYRYGYANAIAMILMIGGISMVYAINRIFGLGKAEQ